METKSKTNKMNENLREMNRRLMMFDLQRSWPMAMLKYNPAENF